MAYLKEQKEKAKLMFEKDFEFKVISKSIGVPERTLRNWKEEYQQEMVKKFNKDELKERFLKSSWQILEKSNQLILDRINRANKWDSQIDEILDYIKECVENKEIKEDKTLKEINIKLSKIKIENLADLTNVVNTMYQKQALLQNESTVNIGVNSSLENFLKEFSGEEM